MVKFMAALSAALMAFSLCQTNGTAQAPNAEADELMQRIRTAWKARQDRVRSAHVEWKGEFLLPKGFCTVYNKDAPIMKQVKTSNGFDPPHDYPVPTAGLLLFKGGNLRYEQKSQRWDSLNQRVFDMAYTETLVGDQCKNLMEPGSFAVDYPIAQYNTPTISWGSTHAGPHAIILHLFGLEPRFRSRFHLDRWEPTLRTVPMLGRPCVELKLPTSNKKQTHLLYLDAERDYAMVRQMIVENNQPTWVFSTQYQPHPELGWMVHHLEHHVRPNGKDLYESSRLTVTRCDLNIEPAADAFELKLPPRTLVLDLSTGQEWQSVVDETGQARQPLPVSVRPTLEQLRAQPLVHSWSRYLGVTLAGAVFFLSLVGAMYVRRRRSPPPPSSASPA